VYESCNYWINLLRRLKKEGSRFVRQSFGFRIVENQVKDIVREFDGAKVHGMSS